MQFDGGPPDGDYVAYVDSLVNRGRAAPGAVPPVQRRKSRRWHREYAAHEADAMFGDGGLAPSRGTGTQTGTATSPPSPAHGAADGPADTLAGRSKARTAGIVQIVIGLGAALIMANIVMGIVLTDEPFHAGQLIPVVILFFIVRQLFKHGLRKLRAGRAPLRRWGPLSTGKPPSR